MIESRWSLQPLTVRDATANDLGAELTATPATGAAGYQVPEGPFGGACGTGVTAGEEEWAPLLASARASGWPV
jgi:hypothetical protein